MSFLDYINPFKDVTNLVSEAIEDPDKANAINAKLMKLAEASYTMELTTKTIPWVDALHKMGRQITGYIGYGLAFYMVHKGGVDPMALVAAVSPGGIYAVMKNKR